VLRGQHDLHVVGGTRVETADGVVRDPQHGCDEVRTRERHRDQHAPAAPRTRHDARRDDGAELAMDGIRQRDLSNTVANTAASISGPISTIMSSPSYR
jgi:hypothetical protein